MNPWTKLLYPVSTMSNELDQIEKQYYTIGEVSKMMDVNPSLIRFWETQFDQLSPKKNRKGNRVYTKKDIEIVRNIYYLVKVRKFTIKGAKDKLKANPKDVEYAFKTRETLLKVREFLVELKNSL